MDHGSGRRIGAAFCRRCPWRACRRTRRWDVEATDAAAAALARSAGAHEVFELMYRYGARDFRDIGHKAIYVANAQRTLGCIGWQHAEPVVRSLAYALLAHEESGNPADADFAADRPWRNNLELAATITDTWRDGRPDAAATDEMLVALRTHDADDAARLTVDLLNRGVAVRSITDAIFAASGELLMRRPGIVPLHAVTTSNALFHAFQSSANDETRRMLLLQNASFVPLFRQAMNFPEDDTLRFDNLAPAQLDSSGDEAPGRNIFPRPGRPSPGGVQGPGLPRRGRQPDRRDPRGTTSRVPQRQ